MRAALLVLLAACGGDPPTIATTELPDGRVAMAYSAVVEVDRPAACSVAAGALPPGLTLAADGTLSGEPGRAGDYSFTVRAATDDGVDEVELTLHVPPVVLISGFGEFGGITVNPSTEAILPLDGELVEGLDVRVVSLPVEWETSWPLLLAEIERLHPAVLLSTGVAAMSEFIRPETTAQNLQWGEDNVGVIREDAAIVPGAPPTLASMLPVDEIVAALGAAGVPVGASDNAGQYLCNHIFYNDVYYAERVADWPLAAGFIHVPAVPSPSFPDHAAITAAHLVTLQVLAGWLAAGKPAPRARARATVHEAPVFGPLATWR